jgi:hypothetical protein
MDFTTRRRVKERDLKKKSINKDPKSTKCSFMKRVKTQYP